MQMKPIASFAGVHPVLPVYMYLVSEETSQRGNDPDIYIFMKATYVPKYGVDQKYSIDLVPRLVLSMFWCLCNVLASFILDP